MSDFSCLSEVLQKALQEALNISAPTPIQNQAFPVLLSAAGNDVIMQAQTGSGKTLAYALPLLEKILKENQKGPEDDSSAFRERVGTLAMVIVPTRELAVQTQNTLTKLLSRVKPHWITTTALTGGDSRKSEKARLRRGCQIVIGTPGRLLDHLQMSEGWRRAGLKWLVVDEADRLADLGFEATVKDILSCVTERSALQMILLSATVTEKLKTDFGGRRLNSPRLIKALQKEVYEASSTLTDAESFSAPESIDQAYLHVPTRLRLLCLSGLLRSMFSPAQAATGSTRVIVFFTCCASVDFHFDLFTASLQGASKKLPALLPSHVRLLRLHGNLDQSTRVSTFNDFIREGKSAEPVQTILFCTDVAARGLDFPNLAGSIQYDAPCDVHDYIHRAGRTGRMSNSKNPSTTTSSKSYLFLMPSEEAYVERLKALGMSKIHAVSFDKYLTWAEKLDAHRLQSFLKSSSKKSKNKESSNETASEEESTQIAALPTTLKARLALLQSVLENAVSADENLSESARDAFLASVRAYATHPANEKDIFHVKRLHLGHFAASFCLDREPKQVGSQHAGQKRSSNVFSTQSHETNRLTFQKKPKRQYEPQAEEPIKFAY